MYKATREFIRDRQAFARFAVQQVGVKHVDAGDEGKAYLNAHRCIDRARNIKLVSGWLVKPYNRMLRHTEILQHWWNIDANTRIYFDTSPGIGRDWEYVTDMDLAEYGIQTFEDVAANLCHSLISADGKYTMVDLIFGELFYKPIDDLATPLLFKKPL